jgi:hypothetical protein
LAPHPPTRTVKKTEKPLKIKDLLDAIKPLKIKEFQPLQSHSKTANR